MLHIVVTCMSRRDMIRQTIEHALAQPDTTYTLVDYSCPEHTGEWVRDRYPAAHVVFVEGRTSWHVSEARNLGAKTIRDGWICFLDSDIILHPEFSQRVLSILAPGMYMTVESKESSLFGFLICRQEDYVRAGGYDEILRDWGGEDIDLRRSLSRLGLTMTRVPDGLVEFIPHDDDLRTQHCGIKDIASSNHANEFYSFVKDILLRQGDDLPTERLRTFYQFGRDRLLAGHPWLSWPEEDVAPSDFLRLLRHIVEMTEGFRSIEADSWGPVRIFRTHRESAPDWGNAAQSRGDGSIMELLSIHNAHRINISAPGRTTLEILSVYGDETVTPVHDEECRITLTASPVFLPADVCVIKDVAVLVTPALGPALAVELTPGPDCNGPLRMSVSLDDEIIDERDVLIDDGPLRLEIPVSAAAPERPRIAEVTVNAGRRTQVVTRRTTFLTAPLVTHEQALQARAPERIYRYTLSETNASHSDGAARDDGWDALGVEVAWGWTETDFVCWIASKEGHGESLVTVAVDGKNLKSPHCSNTKARVHPGSVEGREVGPEPLLEYQVWHGDVWDAMEGAVSSEIQGSRLYTVLRIPFSVIRIAPTAGHTVGVALLITGADGQGGSRWLQWGLGAGSVRNPRLYNEILLAN